MRKSDAVREQLQRRRTNRNGLCLPNLSIRQISLISDNWDTKMPEVDTNLIGSPRAGNNFQKRCAIAKPFDHFEFGQRRQPTFLHGVA